MKKILIATDRSPSSAEAVDFGVELAAEHEAAVIFLHVASALEVVPVLCRGLSSSRRRRWRGQPSVIVAAFSRACR